MNETAAREELEAFIGDSAVPEGDRYILRSEAIAKTLWDAGYRRGTGVDAVLALADRADMHGNHTLYVQEVRAAIENALTP